jgi:YihY family inner membrane protein
MNEEEPRRSGLPGLVQKADHLQQRYPFLALPFSVIKKFGDDNGGYLAALLTYYGFLSLFPLMLVLVTILQLWFKNNAPLRADVAASVSNYFPLLGTQLQANIHSMSKAGLGLAVGLLLTFYGTRGGADALRYALNSIWQVPKTKRSGFPASLLQSLSIMGGGAIAFAATVAVSSFSSALGHAVWVKIAVNIIGFLVATATILFVFKRATSRNVPVRFMIRGAMLAALFIQLLITFGGIVVAHELKNLNSLYGTFAVVIGMLFWIYLLAQVIIYAAEIDSVYGLQLWPRGLQGDQPTTADKRAYKLYANVEKYMPEQRVHVHFRRKKRHDKI